MKRTLLYMIACLTVLTVILSGCASRQIDSDVQSGEPGTEMVSSSDPQNDGDIALQIRVATTSDSIIFALNDSLAARSLYDQLPLTLPVEDYSTNEKIFYPPEALDVSGAPPAEGPAGTLAYYEPWGDVVMFYSPCGNAGGLYKLGEAVSGTERIENLSGEIRIEKVEDPSAEPLRNSEAASQGIGNTSGKDNSYTVNNLPTAHPNSSAPVSSGHSNTTNRPAGESAMEGSKTSSAPPVIEETEKNMRNIEITVNGETFSATLNDNEAAKAFGERLPLTLNMSEMNGNEKYDYLDRGLITDSRKPGRIENGDLMLYGNSCVVLFYESFSTSYSYTPLGRLDNPAGLAEALGSGNVTVTFQIR